MDHMMLTGDDNVPALPMTDAQVAHLRRLLAWMRCEYTLDDDMLRGYVSGATESVRAGVAVAKSAISDAASKTYAQHRPKRTGEIRSRIAGSFAVSRASIGQRPAGAGGKNPPEVIPRAGEARSRGVELAPARSRRARALCGDRRG